MEAQPGAFDAHNGGLEAHCEGPHSHHRAVGPIWSRKPSIESHNWGWRLTLGENTSVEVGFVVNASFYVAFILAGQWGTICTEAEFMNVQQFRWGF